MPYQKEIAFLKLSMLCQALADSSTDSYRTTICLQNYFLLGPLPSGGHLFFTY